jgi:hypothetical protein
LIFWDSDPMVGSEKSFAAFSMRVAISVRIFWVPAGSAAIAAVNLDSSKENVPSLASVIPTVAGDTRTEPFAGGLAGMLTGREAADVTDCVT